MPSAHAVAAAAEPVFVYAVRARAEPGLMPRVLELFAKRGLVPLLWHGALAGRVLTIDIRIAGIDRDTAEYIGRCMGQIAGIDTVLTTTG